MLPQSSEHPALPRTTGTGQEELEGADQGPVQVLLLLQTPEHFRVEWKCGPARMGQVSMPRLILQLSPGQHLKLLHPSIAALLHLCSLLVCSVPSFPDMSAGGSVRPTYHHHGFCACLFRHPCSLESSDSPDSAILGLSWNLSCCCPRLVPFPACP